MKTYLLRNTSAALFVYLLLFSFTISAQTQFGADIDGNTADEYAGTTTTISLDGKRMAVGYPGFDASRGKVKIYEWSSGAWTQLGDSIVGLAQDDRAGDGTSISLSGDGSRIAVGSFGYDSAFISGVGNVRIFEWSGSAWIQKGYTLIGKAEFDHLGWAVSLSCEGTRIGVGSYKKSCTGSLTFDGRTQVYEWSGGNWVQLGANMDGEAVNDYSGWAVSVSGNGSRIAISSKTNTGVNGAAGHVRVYEWSGSAWSQLGSDIDGEAAGDQSGSSVSLSADGTTVAIGAINNDGSSKADGGQCRVYRWSGSAWVQLGQDLDALNDYDFYGYSVSLSADGNTVAVGAAWGNATDDGYVRVFSYNSGTSTWSQVGNKIDGEAASDHSGISVGLTRDAGKLIIGAFYNDGGGSNSGHARVYRFGASDSLATCSNSGLPVELISFKGDIMNKSALLSWTTATEVNNDKFDIEKSLDGINWEYIGEVNGKGNSNALERYSFIDTDAFNKGVTSANYRLKQVDYDGRFEYSPIITLLSTKKQQPVIISANPFNSSIEINHGLDKNTKVNYKLITMHGVFVINESSILSSESSLMIDTQNVPSGMFILQLEINGQAFNYKLQKN